MSGLRRLSFLCLVLVLAPLAAGPAALAQSGLATFETDELVIETQDGARHGFEVELALDPQQQAQGLMFRRDLASDAGMLFVYRPVRVVSMWMRNTVIPLDMIFIGEDGRIEKIVERTVPMSLKTISSDRPVRGVLELNGGTADRMRFAPGDRVLHEVFEEGS
ncbi:MAG: DUF192 domain-containing protein [Rhodospirillales bacterium]|nr:DUF192 domain-containing protein [Rhodospirillales bacterium]